MHIDKVSIKKSFAASSKTYDQAAALQLKVAKQLMEFSPALASGVFLDLGSGTGFLTERLLAIAEYVIALDMALPMLHASHKKLQDSQVLYLCADADHLPLKSASIDSLYSNLALQWCSPTVFSDINRVLKPGGRLVFSTFGSKTLQELKAAWAKVDDDDHVNEFYDEQQLQALVKSSGFTDIKLETRLHLVPYVSVLALMRELKHLGAHNMLPGRHKNITSKAKMQRMIAAYNAENTVKASFEVIMVQATAI